MAGMSANTRYAVTVRKLVEVTIIVEAGDEFEARYKASRRPDVVEVASSRWLSTYDEEALNRAGIYLSEKP